MAWQKTGYQNAVEYDPDRHVLRYGTYEFHGADLGLRRDTYEIDPSKVNSASDVALALGADPKRIAEINAANKLYGAFSSGQQQAFSGHESWKNTAAGRIWEAMNPQQPQQQRVASAVRANDSPMAFGIAEKNAPERTIGTKKLDTGLMQFTFTDPVPADYDFVNRISSMANALSASTGGDLGDQRPRRRTATGAF